MLSIQAPGCAGMERLVIPARTSFGLQATHDTVNHISCRMRAEPNVLQPSELAVSIPATRHAKNYSNIHCFSNMISCPHHVPMSDGEWGPNKDYYQHTEITRSYIKAPPNKTAYDIPEESYSAYESSISNSVSSYDINKKDSSSYNGSMSSSSTSSLIHPTVAQNAVSNNSNNNNHNSSNNQKSKSNSLTKFLFKISSSGSSSKTSEGTSNNQNQHYQNQNYHQQQQQCEPQQYQQINNMPRHGSFSSSSSGNYCSALPPKYTTTNVSNTFTSESESNPTTLYDSVSDSCSISYVQSDS